VGGRDVAVLALLRPTAEQDDNSIAVFAKVDAIPWSEIDSVLEAPSSLLRLLRRPHSETKPQMDSILHGRDIRGRTTFTW
jgi:hypothetical protein